MAKHNFLVERYQITLGDHPKTFGGVEVRSRGVVACFGEFLRLIYYFLPEGAQAPKPMWNEDARLCVCFLPFSAMPAFVDLLRNEKPIYGNIDTDLPGDSFVSTLHEPVGSSGASRPSIPDVERPGRSPGAAGPASRGGGFRSASPSRTPPSYSFLMVAVVLSVMVPGFTPLEKRLSTGPMNTNVYGTAIVTCTSSPVSHEPEQLKVTVADPIFASDRRSFVRARAES